MRWLHDEKDTGSVLGWTLLLRGPGWRGRGPMKKHRKQTVSGSRLSSNDIIANTMITIKCPQIEQSGGQEGWTATGEETSRITTPALGPNL